MSASKNSISTIESDMEKDSGIQMWFEVLQVDSEVIQMVFSRRLHPPKFNENFPWKMVGMEDY